MWRDTGSDSNEEILKKIIGPDKTAKLDRFEKVQLADVLAVCGRSKSLSEAGRKVFAVSRTNKRKKNDADRLSKYLARYGIRWDDI